MKRIDKADTGADAQLPIFAKISARISTEPERKLQNGLADAIGDVHRLRQWRIGEHKDELLATVTSSEICRAFAELPQNASDLA